MKTIILPFIRYALLALAVCIFAGCASSGPSPAPTQARALRTSTDRPGFGTAWGETRQAWVEPTYFARAWGNQPSAKDVFYYNDREGTDAMLDYLGGEPRSKKGAQSMAGGLVSCGLRFGDGRWLDTWELRGKRIAAGEPGARYEVVVKNETRRRVEIVLSVDGLDALDGAAANFKKRGYVIGPREELAIEGFRTSDSTVAAFRFKNVGESYAHRKHGDTTNVGVIGLAVFQERWWSGESHNPANRAWRRTEPKEFPSSRRYAAPPEA